VQLSIPNSEIIVSILTAVASQFCGRSVIGRRGKGYWEGGKGTRDQRLMRRNDPRKYKRIGPAKKDKDKDD